MLWQHQICLQWPATAHPSSVFRKLFSGQAAYEQLPLPAWELKWNQEVGTKKIESLLRVYRSLQLCRSTILPPRQDFKKRWKECPFAPSTFSSNYMQLLYVSVCNALAPKGQQQEQGEKQKQDHQPPRPLAQKQQQLQQWQEDQEQKRKQFFRGSARILKRLKHTIKKTFEKNNGFLWSCVYWLT